MWVCCRASIELLGVQVGVVLRWANNHVCSSEMSTARHDEHSTTQKYEESDNTCSTFRHGLLDMAKSVVSSH